MELQSANRDRFHIRTSNIKGPLRFYYFHAVNKHWHGMRSYDKHKNKKFMNDNIFSFPLFLSLRPRQDYYYYQQYYPSSNGIGVRVLGDGGSFDQRKTPQLEGEPAEYETTSM